MKKIRLNAEDLEVLSFTTAPQPSRARGTIRGAGRTGYTCYHTVAYDRRTICLDYPESYGIEDTCQAVEVTDPSVCPVLDTDPSVCPVLDTDPSVCALDTTPPHC